MTADVSWGRAREIVREAAPRGAARPVRLEHAIGAVVTCDVTAPGPIPHYDSSAMDGWAVRGTGPWRRAADGLTGGGLAGGSFVAVVTGGLLPAGTEAVLRQEAGELRGDVLTGQVLRGQRPPAGLHVRRAGEEAKAGDLLVPAGTALDAAMVAMLQIAGLDEVHSVPRTRVAAVLTGEEVVGTGMPRPGRVRDAFVPLIPEAVRGLGGAPGTVLRVGDDDAVIAAAIGETDGELVLTTGGTGRSEADRIRAALGRLGATVLFDGVAMRPGHPALAARLADRRLLLALPGNPLAAVAVLLSLLPAALAGTAGRPVPAPAVSLAGCAVPGRQGTTLLLPVRRTPAGHEPVDAVRPNMLRGLAASDALALIPPVGVQPGAPLDLLPLPWLP